jgi:RimJ/RimL family protein N-acetyltransferase
MNWSRQTDHAPWAPRSPIAVVFHDKIWIYSGKHTGFDDNWGGDVWQMTAGDTTTGWPILLCGRRASRENMGVPIRFPINTARLTIRPMRLDDAEALLAVYGDVETMQHLNSELPATVEEAREWVQTKIDLFDRDDELSLWTVIHTESGQIVGDVGLQHEDYGSGPVVGLGGRGNREFWRQGLGFEAASATIAAGFEQLNLPAIGAETRPMNLPAQALLAKLGMQPAGTNTQGWPVYMITREEWQALSRTLT